MYRDAIAPARGQYNRIALLDTSVAMVSIMQDYLITQRGRRPRQRRQRRRPGRPHALQRRPSSTDRRHRRALSPAHLGVEHPELNDDPRFDIEPQAAARPTGRKRCASQRLGRPHTGPRSSPELYGAASPRRATNELADVWEEPTGQHRKLARYTPHAYAMPGSVA